MTPMAAQATVAPQGVDTRERPYGDYPSWHLCEMLERQLDRGEPFNERIVFELANRALAAESAAGR